MHLVLMYKDQYTVNGTLCVFVLETRCCEMFGNKTVQYPARYLELGSDPVSQSGHCVLCRTTLCPTILELLTSTLLSSVF